MTPFYRSSRLGKHVSYAHRRTVVFAISRWLSLDPSRGLLEMNDCSPKTGLSRSSIRILRNIDVVYNKSFLPEIYCRNLKCVILQHILPVMTDVLSIPTIPSDIALRWTWYDFTIAELTLLPDDTKPLPQPMFSKFFMSLSRSQRVNIFTDSRWTDWFFLCRSTHGIQLNFQKTKIFGSTSIIHLSDVTVSDRYLINVDPGSFYYQGYSFALATHGGTPSVKGGPGRLSRRFVLLIMPWNCLLCTRLPTLQQVPHPGHSDTKQC